MYLRTVTKYKAKLIMVHLNRIHFTKILTNYDESCVYVSVNETQVNGMIYLDILDL